MSLPIYQNHESVVCYRCGLFFSKQPDHQSGKVDETPTKFYKVCNRCGEHTFYLLEDESKDKYWY